MTEIGLVAIGRNEGNRLQQCLNSVVGKIDHIVYVDSGSTDDSIEFAKSLGIDVISLDLSIPFTAARSRNTGFNYLLATYPQIEYVQFVDGDCEIVDQWLDKSLATIQSSPEVAIVCGRRRERFPEATIYNKLCDIEWDTPLGETKACGGDAMVRVKAFQEVEGFNPTIIAGEEPELCVRLRQNGWKILRIDADMTIHDAQMTKFSQWWKRMLRSGHAYAEGASLHGSPPERHWVKETRSIWLWGLIIPLTAIILMGITKGFSLLLFGFYPLITYRIYRYYQQRGLNYKDAAIYALSCMMGKIPQVQGQIQFLINSQLGRKSGLVEYKS